MKSKSWIIVALLSIGIIAINPQYGKAADTSSLIIVSDPYEPFVFPPNTSLKGLDYEVTQAVFRQLNIPIEIKFYPWKRCLRMVKDRKADAILDLAITEERKTFLFFPEELLSDSSLIIFYHKDYPPKVNSIDDLKQYRIGIQRGYEYPKRLSDVLMKRQYVASMEQNFKKLIINRIDLTIENRVVGLYRSAALGMQDQIKTMPLPIMFPSKNYLGFAKKEGYDHLAEQFSQALIKFKRTQAYHDILVKYGQAE